VDHFNFEEHDPHPGVLSDDVEAFGLKGVRGGDLLCWI
jgi:hypothetical protein